MAGENQNTGPSQIPGGIDPKALRDVFRDIARDQQDLSGAIRDILRDLNKTENAYKNIEARIDRISKGSIDVKSVQREINKLVDKEFITNKANNELKARARQQSKDILEAGKQAARISTQEAAILGKKRDYNEELLAYLQASEDHHALELFYSEQALELAKKRRQEGEVQLEVEKKLANSLGISGKLLKKFADEFGLGTEVYEEMSREARKAYEEGRNFSKLGVVFKVLGAAAKEALKDPLTYIYAAYKATAGGLNLVKQGLDSLTGTGGPVSQFVSPFSSLIKQIPFIGGLLGGIVDIFANLVDLATGQNSEIQKFARNLGISYDEAKKLNNEYDSIARNSGSAYLNAEKFRKAQTELSAALGINNVFSKEILDADIRLAEQAGIELDTRKELAAVAQITGKLQTQTFATIAAQTKVLSANLGVNIRVQDTIKKAASFGGILGLTFAKYPEKLTKTLLITRALGMDLQKIDGIAGGLLDFESSIAKEFEAQLLTGKNINLQKAREYALNNDLLGVANEVNKVVGSTEEFLNMNRLSQESIAESIGMSRDELSDLLKQQALFAAAGVKTEKQFKDRIQLLQQQGRLQEDFVNKLSEEQAQLFLNSTATEKIANFMDKLKQSFANLLNNPGFQDFIDTIMTKLTDPNFINGIINKLTSFVSLLLQAVAAIVDAADVAANVLSLGNVDIDNKIPDSIRKMANELGSVSLGANVAKSQVGFSGTSANSTGIGNSGQQKMNVNVEAYLVHNAKMAKVTYDQSPSVEHGTGYFNKTAP